MPLGSRGYLLYKTTLPRLEDITNLSNIHEQTQRGSKNREVNKHAPNKRTGGERERVLN